MKWIKMEVMEPTKKYKTNNNYENKKGPWKIFPMSAASMSL